MSQYSAAIADDGSRIQAAVSKGVPVTEGFLRAHGLLLRGVVVKTFEVDNPQHPYASNTPKAIYCDVLTYSGTSNTRWRGIKSALVTQDLGAMHRGNIWKPRATTMNSTGLPVDLVSGPQPWAWDGDHVLVGFMDDSLNLPVILRGVPHPSADVGNELKPIGNRTKLNLIDGDPSFWKHHGSFFGVKDNGDFTVDTTQANTGVLLPMCQEPPPPLDGSGSQIHNLPKDAAYSVVLKDMAPTIAPTPGPAITVCELNLTQTQIQLLITAVNSLLVSGTGPLAVLTVGTGTPLMHVPIAENLGVFYNALQVKLNAFDKHTHQTPAGPSDPPSVAVAAAAWDASALNSTHICMPDH